MSGVLKVCAVIELPVTNFRSEGLPGLFVWGYVGLYTSLQGTEIANGSPTLREPGTPKGLSLKERLYI